MNDQTSHESPHDGHEEGPEEHEDDVVGPVEDDSENGDGQNLDRQLNIYLEGRRVIAPSWLRGRELSAWGLELSINQNLPFSNLLGGFKKEPETFMPNAYISDV